MEKIGDIYNDDTTKRYYETIGKEISEAEIRTEADRFLWSLIPENLSGKKALDLGCGNGRYAELFCKRGAEQVVGVDLSASMIEQAQGRKKEKGFGQLEFIKEDIAKISFNNGNFDFIFSRFSLPYLNNMEESIKRMSGFLKSRGQFLIETDFIELSDTKIADEIKNHPISLRLKTEKGDVSIKNYAHQLKDYTEAFNAAGLKLLNQKIFSADDLTVNGKYKDLLKFEYIVFNLVKE